MIFTTDGLVLRIVEIGDHDRLLTLLTPNYGRIRVMAKGVSTLRSSILSIVQMFTYGNYEIYRKGDSYWLRDGSVINTFYALSDDIERLALASYISEAAIEMSDEGEDATDTLRLVLNTFYAICKQDRPYSVIKAVYELRMVAMAGYCPDLSGCDECEKFISDDMYFDVMNGRLMCDECFHKKSQGSQTTTYSYSEESADANIICPVTSSSVTAMRYALSVPVQRMFSFSLTDKQEQENFSKACETYLLSHLGRGFDSLNFYKSVKSI